MVDSGRLYYEAALLFDDMAAYDRAIVCYLRSTKFCDASDVIASIDLPEDDTYRKKLERMSNSYLSDFHVKRSGLRERLLFAEKERQRLRVSKIEDVLILHDWTVFFFFFSQTHYFMHYLILLFEYILYLYIILIVVVCVFK